MLNFAWYVPDMGISNLKFTTARGISIIIIFQCDDFHSSFISPFASAPQGIRRSNSVEGGGYAAMVVVNNMSFRMAVYYYDYTSYR
jgi:hypothetical protein